MAKFLIVAAIGAAAVAIALWTSRRARSTPVEAQRESTVPAQLDRSDFVNPLTPWLIVVFSSSTCAACAEVLATAASFGGPGVSVQDVEFTLERSLHQRYRIDTVPTTVLVDLDGAVRAHWLGQIDSAELLATIDSTSPN
jgi:thioredoxin-related protein